MVTSNYNSLSEEDRKNLDLAEIASKRSVSENGNVIGAVLVCANGAIHSGATIARTRVIGSTCSERMALDQWYFENGKDLPTTCYLIGQLNRSSWDNSFACMPCGVCLEMFYEFTISYGVRDFRFVCSSWDKSTVIDAQLSELFPQSGKGEWPHGTKR